MRTTIRKRNSFIKEATVSEVSTYFQTSNKHIVTFVGYSKSEYQNRAHMLDIASGILDEYESSSTIVNIGATPAGIGAVYELAMKNGFTTTGIVSIQAKTHSVALSQWVDYVFYINDESWGGYHKDSDQLSPTSTAMIEISNEIIGIGGGPISRDELFAARKAGKKVRFIAADMNHAIARQAAIEKGLPEPTVFTGAAHKAHYSH